MSRERGITELQGPDWGIIYDPREAPEYILITFRGAASRNRTERLLELLDADHARVRLPTGQICPIIALSYENPPPSAMVLRSEYDLLDEIIPQVSCLIFVLGPEQLREPKVQLALEATGLSVAPNIAVVTTLDQALAKVQEYHRSQDAP